MVGGYATTCEYFTACTMFPNPCLRKHICACANTVRFSTKYYLRQAKQNDHGSDGRIREERDRCIPNVYESGPLSRGWSIRDSKG